MIFNSYPFLFLFLPPTLAALLFAQSRKDRGLCLLVLILSSIVSYWFGETRFFWLLIASMLANFGTAHAILAFPQQARRILATSIVSNILLLGFYKYASPSQEGNAGTASINIPLGMSFFTFQQISYLVDVFRKRVAPARLNEYAAYVLFFPQLIAGPIVRAKDFFSQLRSPQVASIRWKNLHDGALFISFGLFKKVVFADGISTLLSDFTRHLNAGHHLGLVEAWSSAAAFSFQLYFDFSGYSDIAIGLGLLFNIRLPINFFSPQKSDNIADFWRRWNMTVSQFIRDYAYSPLLRLAPARRSWELALLFLTILLFGIWHGASWNFVILGAGHGTLLAFYSLWAAYSSSRNWTWTQTSAWTTFARALTWLTLLPFQSLFQFQTLKSARLFSESMLGWGAGANSVLGQLSVGAWPYLLGLLSLLLWIQFAPNTVELILPEQAAIISGRNRPRPFRIEILTVAAAVAFVTAVLFITFSKEYLYFAF